MGDWNARMQKAQNKTERKVVGKWTLEPEKTKVQELCEEVTWNRDRCIEFCLKQELILANTKIEKREEKQPHSEYQEPQRQKKSHTKNMNR